MWKKDEMPGEMPTSQLERIPERPAHIPPTSVERATIGRSITVRGDVTGDEDLMIQGRVEGSVDLQQHAITVGPDGEVSASIVGRVVTIEGRVEGNIDGGEQVILRNSAYVQGDITAPRVVLENGARFRGLVDMGDADEQGKRTGAASRSDTRRGIEAVRSTPSTPLATENGKATTEATPDTSDSTDATRAMAGQKSSSGSSSSGSSSSRSGKGNSASEVSTELRL